MSRYPIPNLIPFAFALSAVVAPVAAATGPDQPQAVWGKQYAYVVQEDLKEAKDYLVRVNVATGVVEQRFDVIENGMPYVAANTPLQRMYFIEESLDRLVELDLRTGVVQRYIVGGDPHGIAVSPDGSRVYIAQYADDTLAIFDTANLAAGPMRTVPVGDRPFGVVVHPAGTVVYVTNPGSHSVSAVDVREDPPVVVHTSLANGSHGTPNPLGITLSMDGGAAFVALSNASAIAVLNTTALLPVYVADVASFSTPIGVASNPNSALAYAAAKGSNVVQYLNYAVWPILTPYAPAVAGTEPYGIAVDRTGSRVLTLGLGTPAVPNDGRMSVFEASTGQLQWSLRLGFNRALFGDFVIEEIDLPLLVDGFEE
ncbi:MAG: YncE family protein [Xanthomonadales bacterium]|nr:YncE family protein [Xanthomonadales bacterium]